MLTDVVGVQNIKQFDDNSLTGKFLQTSTLLCFLLLLELHVNYKVWGN